MHFASTLSFILAFATGIILSPQIRPVAEWIRPSEYLNPSFSRQEADVMVGRRITCLYHTDTMDGGCQIGQLGNVVDIKKVPDGGYFIVVRWDGQNQTEEPSYYGRYSSRLFIAEK